MQAIEFETQSDNGVIKIPEEFSEFASGKMKVVLMKETPAEPQDKLGQMQRLIDEGLESGIGEASMSELLQRAKKQFHHS
jgi:hypothetical protein